MMATNCGHEDSYFMEIVDKKKHADWFLDAKEAKKHNLANHLRVPTIHIDISVTFRCKVPLFVRSQHHRHRTWSYNEISRRYTEVDLCFYEPDKFRTQHESNRQASTENLINPNLNPFAERLLPVPPYLASDAIKSHHEKSLQLYNTLLDKGICREQARGILPQNLYTEYYATCNLNNLMKFIALRDHDGAQWEIQKLAAGMREIASKIWPVAVSSYSNES